MGARFLSSTGLGFSTFIERERSSSQHWCQNWSPMKGESSPPIWWGWGGSETPCVSMFLEGRPQNLGWGESSPLKFLGCGPTGRGSGERAPLKKGVGIVEVVAVHCLCALSHDQLRILKAEGGHAWLRHCLRCCYLFQTDVCWEQHCALLR